MGWLECVFWQFYKNGDKDRIMTKSRTLLSNSRNTHRWQLVSHIILPLGIFLGTIALGIFISRAQFGLQCLSYSYLHTSLQILNGDRFTSSYPPGYSILIATLVRIGISPIIATWSISIISFGATSCLVYYLTQRFTSKTLGLIACLLFAFNYEALKWANMVMPEMLFCFTAIVSFTIFDVWATISNHDSHMRRLTLSVATGVLLGMTFWVRYVGVLFIVLGLIAVVVISVHYPVRRWEAVVCCLSAVSFIAPLPIRNWVYTGTLTGHPWGVLPATTFLKAIRDLLFEMRCVWMPKSLFTFTVAGWDLLSLLMATLYVGFITLTIRKPRSILVFTTPMLYIFLFAYIASHARIDVIYGSRFVIVMTSLIVVSFALIWNFISQYGRTLKRVLIPWLVVGVIVTTLLGGATVMMGWSPPKAKLSPNTLDFINENVSKGTTIAVNRYGEQLTATALDYDIVGIPFLDPWNADYTSAYGVQLWTRSQALNIFIEKDIRFVIFFMGGKEGRDSYLDRHCYGKYVESLLDPNSPEVMAITELQDGVIISLVPENQLRLELKKESSTSRIGLILNSTRKL